MEANDEDEMNDLRPTTRVEARRGNGQPGARARAPVSDEQNESASEAEAPKSSILGRLIALLVIAIGVGGVVAWYVMHEGLETTEDAQVEADVVAVPARVGGIVQQVLVVENQTVKAGDLIAVLDSKQQEARLAQAEAEVLSAQASAAAADAQVEVVQTSAKGQHSIAEASLKGQSMSMTTTTDDIAQARAAVAANTANLHQAELDLSRAKALFAENAVPKSRLDAAQTAFEAADANLAQVKARLGSVQSNTAVMEARVAEARARVGQTSSVGPQIAQAQAAAAVAHARVQTAQAARDLTRLDLSYTKITAPAAGVASKKGISVGQMVSPGQPVVMIVPTKEVWVTANFKETQLAHLRAGQPAEVDIDAFPGLKLKGEVESLSGGTGSRFSLLPAENATGNFVKVVQRVPVRIKLKELPESKELRPGMSAFVTVDMRGK